MYGKRLMSAGAVRSLLCNHFSPPLLYILPFFCANKLIIFFLKVKNEHQIHMLDA